MIHSILTRWYLNVTVQIGICMHNEINVRVLLCEVLFMDL